MPARPAPSSAPRTIAASLGFVLSLACAFPASASDSVAKLNLMIPPGHSQLDDLQREYEKTSKELQASFEAVQKNAPACTNGAQLAKLVSKGAPWQKAQREKIVKALNQSTADLQTEIAQLDQTAAEGAGSSQALTAAASRDVIAKGIDQPETVIKKELPSAQTFSLRLRVTNDAASQLLTGDDPACAKARTAFFARMKPQAEALTEKLKLLVAALEQHKKALNSYADSVVKKPNRSPASN